MKLRLKLLVLILSFNLSIKAQHKNQLPLPSYVLLQLYTDSTFNQMDTLKHSIFIYYFEGKSKQQLQLVNGNLFSSTTKVVKGLFLNIDRQEIGPIDLRERNLQFTVIKTYVNKSCFSSKVNITYSNGEDLLVTENHCSNCHQIEYRHPTLIGIGDQLTTGYKELDPYILK